MSITIYRRHLKKCDVHKLGLPASALRSYIECECPIWMVGRTDTSLLPRQSTGLTNMKAAEILRASLVAKDKEKDIHGPRIDECAEKYLSSRQSELGETAMDHHTLLLNRLTKYCAKYGTHHMSELTVDLLEDFKVDGLPKLADASKATYVSKLRCFLKDAYRRGWLKETLAEKVKSHHAVFEQKVPYTDDEVEKILAGALAMKGGRSGYMGKPQTFRLLLELMLETGMRVGDAIQYDPAKVIKGERLWVYSYRQQKDKKTQKIRTTDVYLTDRLKAAIESCVWYSPRRPFLLGSSKDPGVEVNKTMQSLGSRCGVNDCRPHRLRDTFAVRKLLAGLHMDDVSRLLGHSSVVITEKYYAAWVPGRKARLEAILADSLVDT